MNWFCPVSFNGFYFLMSSLAPWQGHLVKRTWFLDTASPWFLVSLLIFWVLSLINQMTLGKFFRPSEPVSSFQWFLPSDLLMSLEEMWYIYHPAPLFTSLIAGCQRDMASQAISLLFLFIYSSQGATERTTGWCWAPHSVRQLKSSGRSKRYNETHWEIV